MPTYPRPLTSRLPEVGTTIFSVMSALASEHGALNLSQGFPDFDAPAELLSLLDQHARAGHNQYAPMTGVPVLREAIAAKVSTLYGAQYDVDAEITVTAGATQAIFTAVAALVHPGDEVIVFTPVYDSYAPSVELQGGKVVYAHLTLPDYRPDWDEVARLITPRTRMIILNSPHNPTGTVWTAEDMAQLEALVKDTDIVLLSDEVYEHMVFDQARHESVLRYPGLAERSLVVSSFGKTYHITGWKVAYCLAPRELMAEFRKAHQFIVFTVHAPSQYALADFMKKPGWYDQLKALYQGKRDIFRQALAGSRFELLPCQGTYFQCVKYAAISDEGDRAFVERLTRDHGVAAIPVSAFYPDGEDHGVIRFCFAKSAATLEQALERLIKL
ncbi:pyridoxal phosphate-dependent aminotransferase [Aquabacterium sp.]|uniref:pyridoxal phosphate-dependent aminotransferase n=1 Tax=Aquabacterium sp. TaxID=1872578 RepID=UPI001B6844BA|nr:pyridoxal phosphate-dependent aminotransferase [Aquabacterium sp.]MBP7503044.1 pyridoxal phosphate-dependent aminotransferase [Aquabacterium sp.]MDD2978111.1 pyridoxal phosphate-dependent aminotransferase [Aquabacterium sp.]